jgi:hypothetical protein
VAVGILSPGWVKTDMGGPSAALTVETSAKGLLQQIAVLDLTTSGAFGNYAGQPLPW